MDTGKKTYRSYRRSNWKYKIADTITSIDKPKKKEKTKEIEEIYNPPEKGQQSIDDLRWL